MTRINCCKLQLLVSYLAQLAMQVTIQNVSQAQLRSADANTASTVALDLDFITAILFSFCGSFFINCWMFFLHIAFFNRAATINRSVD